MLKTNKDQSVKTEIAENLLPLYHVMQPMEGKNVLILGYGREGQATLHMLQKLVPGAKLTVADIREQKLPEGVHGIFGDGYQDGLTAYDVVIKSPGLSLPINLRCTGAGHFSDRAVFVRLPQTGEHAI